MYYAKNSEVTRDLTASGICLALCVILPFMTGQLTQIGAALALMHIPVLLCGFIAGPVYAISIGFIAPLLRFAIVGTPPIAPVLLPNGSIECGLAMCFELAVYGFATGLIYKAFPRKISSIYATLACAMILGRIAWGVAMRIIVASLGPVRHINIGTPVENLIDTPLGNLVNLPAEAPVETLHFTWDLFITGAFINAFPGIILHLLLIPVVVIALQKSRIIE
jgi:thiamine transporter ThiT